MAGQITKVRASPGEQSPKEKPGPQTGTGPDLAPLCRVGCYNRNSVIAGKATRMITRMMSEPTKNITAL